MESAQDSEEEASGHESESQSSLDSSVRSGGDVSSGNRIIHLASRVHEKLCVPDNAPLAVKAHRQAVRAMLELRDLLMQRTENASQEVRVLLLTAGVAVQRRVALIVDQGEEFSDLTVTLSLLFMLQVLCDREELATPSPVARPAISPSLRGLHADDGDCAMDTGADAPPECVPDEAPNEIVRWETSTLQQSVLASVKRPPRSAERLEDEVAELGEEERRKCQQDDWAAVLQLTPELVSHAALAEAHLLGAEGTLAKLAALARTFFRSSALAMQYSLLQGSRPASEDRLSFLTLGTVDFMHEANDDLREKRLAAIVDAAESESGQQVLRDMILSFTLPRGVVGMRRTVLLGRETNRVATESYTKELGEAHEAAMRGAEWSWREDEEVVHQMAALLAGLCILVGGRGGGADYVRKGDAFRGRVQLPFLETPAPAPNVSRICYVPHSDEWMVYSVNQRGAAKVQLRHLGMEGLKMAVMLVAKEL